MKCQEIQPDINISIENITTNVYANIDKGDWIHCTSCGKNMLVPYGTEICPECGMKGCLGWIDDNHPEMSLQHLPNITETGRRIQLREVFVVDTIKAEYPHLWLKLMRGEVVYC